MVRRAVATGRGPAGLLLWLRCRVTTWPVPRPTERFVLALTAELLGAMADSRGGMPKKSGGG
jgi:hypothetical protein